MGPKRPPRRFLGPKSGPKRPPGGPQDAPRRWHSARSHSQINALPVSCFSGFPKMLKNHGFYMVFCSSGRKKGGGPKNGPQEASKTHFGPQKWPPRGPQEAPKRPQEAPGRPQDAPKRAPEAPGPPPGAPKTPPRGFPDAPDRPPSALKAVCFVAKLPKTRKSPTPS